MSHSRSASTVIPLGPRKHRGAGLRGFQPAPGFPSPPAAVCHAAPRPCLRGSRRLPVTGPRKLPVAASTATMAWSSSPWPLPLPTLPRPRRRSGRVGIAISLVSWIARTWQPAAATAVRSLQPSIRRSTVTRGLPRKRPKPLRSLSFLPSASSATREAATIAASRSAPFLKGARPRTDQQTSSRTQSWRHPVLAEVP